LYAFDLLFAADDSSRGRGQILRFVANGPSIPDELLVARDEGRVVFFCGAGVSRARAGLSDFLELARAVADKLAISRDSVTRKLISAIETFPPIEGVGSLISADRVFSLIEREFLSRDIYGAIAASLKPPPSPDLSAHRTLLDLTRGPDGTVRLVTTNFDLLFEACDPTMQSWRPPRLPDPLRNDEFRGIIHLHGHVNDDYTHAAGDGFVISSAEFGQAYLSERWATDFIRTVLEKFLVVFVGYAADDPPMQYLLEALNRREGSLSGVYAFQSGSIEDAQARWVQKGVHPIAYESTADHAALWDTLSAWAIRARDPDRWYNQTITSAQAGPAALEPYKRGQVAHVVSTIDGARRFAQATILPPATWLCVFDPHVRFSSLDRIYSSTGGGDYFDPFDAFGLDDDPVPPKPDPNDHLSRKVPRDVWDCFALGRQDRQNLQEDQYPALRGHWSLNAPRLSRRLDLLGDWLTRVADQPAAVWWAANQLGLHPDIQRQIRIALQRDAANFPHLVRKAWRLIFDAWDSNRRDFHRDWFELRGHVKADGWSESAIRLFSESQRPHLTVQGGDARPPEAGTDLALRQLVRLDVEYPAHDEPISVPDEHLPHLLRELRKNLELGVALETEIGGYGLAFLPALEVDAKNGGSFRSGISKPIASFVSLFRKLADTTPHLARAEATAWKSNTDPIFVRLLIWSCGDNRLFSASEAAKLFRQLNNDDFWNGRHQRDLLLSLAKRWNEFTPRFKGSLERRLLRGRPRWKGEKRNDFLNRRAGQTLSRIHWLASQGCKFTFDLVKVTETLKANAPQWNLEHAKHAVDSLESRTGWVRTDTDSSALKGEPLSNILTKAQQLSGRTSEMFVEKDPFAGFVTERPVRAFASLVDASKQGQFPSREWRTFLSSKTRENDKPRLIVAIAARLTKLLRPETIDLLRPASDWLSRVSESLLEVRRDIFEQLWGALIALLTLRVEAGVSSILREKGEPDWATEALNSPVGSMTQALMADPAVKDLKAGAGLPAWWIAHANELLLLPATLRHHALPLLTHNLVWLFNIDPLWTKQQLLPFCEADGDDLSAFWAGFFWGARIPGEVLYLQMKPALMKLASERTTDRRQHTEVLAGVILDGWQARRSATGERLVSDDETRRILLAGDEEFRTQVIWYLERWSQKEGSPWRTEALTLLQNVWPRQVVAKTPRVSARLAELAFSQGDEFPDYVNAVLPLVTRVTTNELSLPITRREENNVVEKFPEKALSLLSAVLPDDAKRWPYGIEDVLKRIGKADPPLLLDSRMIELNRKWNAR